MLDFTNMVSNLYCILVFCRTKFMAEYHLILYINLCIKAEKKHPIKSVLENNIWKRTSIILGTGVLLLNCRMGMTMSIPPKQSSDVLIQNVRSSNRKQMLKRFQSVE